MLRINCPICGLRDDSEFSYGEDASVTYPELTNSDRKSWFEAVFLRDNPRGLHQERWHHVQGCRQWLIVERDTLTHEIFSVKLAHPKASAMLKAPRVSGAAKAGKGKEAKSTKTPKTKLSGSAT